VDWAKRQPRGDGSRREASGPLRQHRAGQQRGLRFLEQNRAAVQSMEAGRSGLPGSRVRLEALVDVLVVPKPCCATGCAPPRPWLSVGATCMFFLQEVHDGTQAPAIVLEMATDLIS